MKNAHYRRLLLMVVLSFITMYVLMYAMVNSLENVYMNLVAFLKVLPTMPEGEYQGVVEHYGMNTAGTAKQMQAEHQH